MYLCGHAGSWKRRASAFVVARDGFAYWRPRWALTAAASSLSSRRGALASGARLLVAEACRAAERRLAGSVICASPLQLLLATFGLPGPWVETLCLLPFKEGFLPTGPPGKPPQASSTFQKPSSYGFSSEPDFLNKLPTLYHPYS